MKEITKIKESIQEYNVVSFDIFDTLILRNIEQPTDIFKIIENKYKVKNFFKNRILAESQSRIGQKNYEANLNRIYDFLQKMYKEDIKKVKEIEMQIEYDFICQNTVMKEIFDYCKKQNKKIFLISDMYLPKEFIQKLLKKCGYEKYNNLYISNEIMESKHIGGLYDYVMKQEKIKTEEWIHIGDNKHSDIAIPKEKGIKTYYYKNVYQRVERKSKTISVEEAIFRGIQNNYLLNHELDYWEEFGIKYISPLYYSFTNWLVNLTKKEDNIYFLSRDGYIVKKIYELFKEKLNLKLDLNYLYTSRLAYQVPINVFYEKDVALRTFTDHNVAFGHYLTINEVFEILELNPNNYKDIIATFGFSSDYGKRIEDFQIYNLKKLILAIYPDIKNKFKMKLELIKKYLIQEKLLDYKKINLVDVGWRGSIQKSIKDILDDKEIYGYYFGINQFVWSDIKNETFGFAIDGYCNNENSQFILDNLMMFELIFSAPEGTLFGFKENKSKIIPIIEKNNSTSECIEIFQNSAIELVKKYLNYYEYLKFSNINDAMQDYKDFINYKQYKDVYHFSKLDNDIGLTSTKKKYVETFEKSYVYEHYEKFLSKTSQSLWKNSFLIKGIANEEEYEDFKMKLYEMKAANEYKYINKYLIKKALKNPKKALNVIKIKLDNKKIN